VKQIYTKNCHFGNCGAVSTHFKSCNGEVRCEGADLGFPPHAKFCKNHLRGLAP